MCSLNSLRGSRNSKICVPHNHMHSLARLSYQNILCMHKLSDQSCNPGLHPPAIRNLKIHMPHKHIYGTVALNIPYLHRLDDQLCSPDLHLPGLRNSKIHVPHKHINFQNIPFMAELS